ncbi:MAG: hypothetical protein CVV62_00160 [Tenericutes bacterium HGW-Tenericutes-7]|nr:MAG: hypothetical protein CVV62_00160 [Tenericutes bacterium HGW-Tenericutes-7]PKK96908.1 MAG: hypothetical protein CVV58_03945 [Tenericutes bacterium HGW-Tenericutes-3]
MSKQNLYLLINTLILLVLGLGFILLYATVIPTEPKDRLFGEVITCDEEVELTKIPVIGHYEILHTVHDAYNLSGDKIGTVYHVIARNGFIETPDDEFGYIELLVGIDLDDLVYVEIITLSQTSVYNVAIQNYIYEYYQGFEISGLLSIPVVNVESDLESGATASMSTGAVKRLVTMAINEYLNPTLSLSEVTKG